MSTSSGEPAIRMHLLLLMSTTFVSTSFIVAKIITATLDPIILTFTRFVIAALILLPVIALRHGLRLQFSALLRYGAISGCLVIFFWSMFLSLRYTSPLNVSVLFTLVPAISAVYSVVLNRERIGPSLAAALLIGMAGAIWVIFRGDPARLAGLELNRGDLIFFGGCLVMGLYTPLVRRLHRGEPMEIMTFWVLTTGSLWLLPAALLSSGGTTWAAVPVSTWLWIVYLAVFSTVVSFYMTQSAARVIGPTRTIAYSYLYPALVLLIEFLLGSGWPELRVAPGILLGLVTMVMLLWPATERRRRGGPIQKL